NARILDRQRREALLEALNTYGPEEAMYATLGDLNGDGTEDLLIYGKGVFEEPGRTRYDFTFTALIWDGTEVQRIPLQQGGMSDLGYISSDDAAVYRERETGALYVSNPFSEDGWHTLCFENAVDYVSFSYSYNPNATKAEAGNLSAEEIAEREKVYQEINARFELFDSLEFSAADDEYQSTDYWWWWKSYWNRGRTDMPGYPPFHASVEEVRQSLSAP
ncbi:MAG: hypothetical protein HFH95_09865, partial [Lachnospiraceae bacterium]|nr:hypothetical protein [Lachnospiraceae bacterium]